MTKADRKKAIRAWQAERAADANRGSVVHHDRWFFVVHVPIARRRAADVPYEVQRLDEHGRGIEAMQFGDPASRVELGGEAVPSAVLRSATELPEGQGCYVDETGWEVTPSGHPVAADVARATGGRGRDRA